MTSLIAFELNLDRIEIEISLAILCEATGILKLLDRT